MKSKIRISLIILMQTFLGYVVSAQNSTPNSSTVNERTQLEFCATYIPCAIAVGFMDVTVASMSIADKIKIYLSTFGSTPIRTEYEFRNYLQNISASQRQRYVKKCLEIRGSNMLDLCEKDYLLESELKVLQASRQPQSVDVTKESAQRARQALADKEADLMSVLGPSCRMTERGPSYGCSSTLDEITRLDRRVTAFNNDFQALRFVPPFESAAINKILNFYIKEIDHGVTKWIPKESTALSSSPAESKPDSDLAKPATPSNTSQLELPKRSRQDNTATQILIAANDKARQDESEAARRIELAKRAQLLEEQRRADAAAAEAARRAAVLEAEAAFRGKLNTMNPGQLFAMADELSAKSDTTKAREALRTLISRFPNHPLAVAAAQQMSSMAGQASANATGGSTAGTRTNSGASCTSALNQLQAKFNQLDSSIASRANERIMMQQLWAQQKFRSLARSYPGCTASERDSVDGGIAQNQQVCRSGGYSGDCNLGYDAYGWSNAVDATIAEIMAGAGSATAGTTNGNASAQNCDSRLATQEREFEAVNRRPVPAGATPPLRRVMWMTSERIKLIQANCPSTAKYQQMIQELQTVYDQSDKACGQMVAGNMCPGPNPY